MSMTRSISALALAALVALGVTSGAGAGGIDAGPKVQAELVAPVAAIAAGKPFTVGLRQVITPHWHTYWRNPGDSGEPTRLGWTLPDGFTASPISWPIPEAIPVGPLMNFGYSNEVLLPVTITPPEGFRGSSVTLSARAEWLVCEKVCIPEEKTVTLTLDVVPAASPPTASPSADLFAAAARALPVDGGWPALVSRGGGRVILDVAAHGLDRSRIVDARFFPDAWGAVENAAPQRLTWTDRGLSLDMQEAEGAPANGGVLEGVLVLTETLADGERIRNGFIIRTGAAAPATAATAPPPAGLTLWQAVLFAVVGGLILNLMPCVLPILSIKVMALASHDGRRGGTSGGLAYLAGVAASFTALAGVIILVRGAGEVLGWGFQFQSPVFVLILAAMFLAMGLAMSGVFDIGGSVVGAGESLTRRDGLSGSFFTGVLATVAATPCTAPFMGAAIGYAMTRPALELILVLQALGLGFAAPILVLSASRAAARLLPRPGPWMKTLKEALAFPLYGTVAWLVWVLSLQAGSEGVLASAIVLVSVAFAAWIVGQRHLGLGVRGSVAAAACIAAFALALPQVRPPQHAASARAGGAGDEVAEAFSIARVDALRSAGRPVFVNLTAAWCITCKVNERLALDTEAVRKALKDNDIAYLKGDWTSRDDAITRVLGTYGRAGVPLYLLFPADRAAQAVVLPQLLTEAIVLRHFASLKDASPRP